MPVYVSVYLLLVFMNVMIGCLFMQIECFTILGQRKATDWICKRWSPGTKKTRHLLILNHSKLYLSRSIGLRPESCWILSNINSIRYETWIRMRLVRTGQVSRDAHAWWGFCPMGTWETWDGGRLQEEGEGHDLRGHQLHYKNRSQCILVSWKTTKIDKPDDKLADKHSQQGVSLNAKRQE